MTTILFPSQPFNLREIDPDFAEERAAATAAGFSTALVDHSRVMRGDAGAAVAAAPMEETPALFRGWMLRPHQYAAMHQALADRGVRLVNDPGAYRRCHYLPESLDSLGDDTARTTWMPVRGSLEMSEVARCVAPFGSSAIIVKDYVKSQKHYWNEACFIPSAADLGSVERVVRKFLELQGEDLNEGLVFREYLPLEIIGRHPRSGMPLAAELRIFWLDHQVALAHRYWAEFATADMALPLEQFAPIAAKIESRFFTMDVARRQDGRWTVVELGDGQVAGLPSVDVAAAFYGRLRTILRA